MSNNIYVYAVGMTKFGKFLDKNIKKLTKEVLDEVLKDSRNEVNKKSIEAAWFSNCLWGMYENQQGIRGQVALSANRIDNIPITNVENACASASTALHGAWANIKAGLYDCALAIGVEKIYHEDRKFMMKGFSSFTDVGRMRKLIEQLKKYAEKHKAKEENKQGSDVNKNKKGGHSAFMDLYAAAARTHMKKYGTTQRQLAAVAAKNHNNSTSNPLAQYNFPMTIEQVMEDYEVAYPFTRAMCAPVGDGAAAAIICSEKFLKEHPNDRAVLIKASVLKSGSWSKDDIGERASKAAYKIAGLQPKDIDVVEVHDATAFGEINQIEQIGLCPIGEGGPFTESGATALDGTIPVNPSGGLISRGHPIGASGLAQIYELVTQLRGEAGKRQVANPKIALAENGGGNIGLGEAAMNIHILERN